VSLTTWGRAVSEVDPGIAQLLPENHSPPPENPRVNKEMPTVFYIMPSFRLIKQLNVVKGLAYHLKHLAHNSSGKRHLKHKE